MRAPKDSREIGFWTDCASLALEGIRCAGTSLRLTRGLPSPSFPRLARRTLVPTPVLVRPVQIASPTDYGEIYQAALAVVSSVRKQFPNAELTYHLSPGTPAMAAIWVLLAKTLHPATLIQSSKEHGVVVAEIPFDISAEFVPSLRHADDLRLEQMLAAHPPESPAFDDIIHRSPQMTAGNRQGAAGCATGCPGLD